MVYNAPCCVQYLFRRRSAFVWQIDELRRQKFIIFFAVGLMHDDLRAFLTDQLPKGQSVGINDSRLLQVVKEELGVPVAGGDIVAEICRGVRLNIDQLIKQLELKKVRYL